MPAAHLPHRSIIRIGGADARAFLQNLVSNDVSVVTPTCAVYAALLTPQGKFLHDLFILGHEDSFLIDCERPDDLLNRLTAYKLRSKVTFENLADKFDVWAVWNGAYAAPLSFPDPRLPELGMRVFVAKNKTPENAQIADLTAYDTLRYNLGVADGSRDLDIEKSTLAEGNFDFLNGIDWKKGCYIGQELTARMHYRGLAKKRLFPVWFEGVAPGCGALFDHDAGEMRSSSAGQGLALLKIEAVRQALDEKTPLTCGNTRFRTAIPDWMKIDATPVNR